MARRQHLTLMIVVVVALFLSISYFFGDVPSRAIDRLHVPHANTPETNHNAQKQKPAVPVKEAPRDKFDDPGFKIDLNDLPSIEGESIAPKLENATLKAELGRATWRFLHTMVARYPEKPTPDERKTLQTFIHLFGRLYPCGDCARHFRGILEKYPPQTSSRNAAAGWLCFAHNQVNERLKKEIFDCNNIGDFYDCGCGDDKKKADGKKTDAKDDKKDK